MRYTAKQIKQWEVDCANADGVWMPARSLNHEFESWRSRIVNAWRVLTGRYDALDWEEA